MSGSKSTGRLPDKKGSQIMKRMTEENNYRTLTRVIMSTAVGIPAVLAGILTLVL